MQANQSQPVERFRSVLEATGGTVQRVTGAHELTAAVARVAREQGVREILYEPSDLSTRFGLKLLLAAHGIDLLPVPQAREKAHHLRVSLTGAEMAIADTGTLVLGGQPGGWGLASVLPWVHIVMLPADVIVDELSVAFDRFAERLSGGERDWVWITGPSRTADIGHTLVLGAHGPNALRVMVVE